MLSHQHKTIFIHIPKTAGQSIETLFLDDLGLKWSERASLLLRPNPNATLGPPRLAHLTITEYLTCGYTSRPIFDHYFKFCFVRNPWDRAVSMYKYLANKTETFEEFLTNGPGNPDSKLAYFFKPQTHYILDPNKRVKVDFIGNFETLKEDLDSIITRLHLNAKLKHVNSSRAIPSKTNAHCSYRDFYCQKTRKLIEKIYASDAKTFNYEF